MVCEKRLLFQRGSAVVCVWHNSPEFHLALDRTENLRCILKLQRYSGLIHPLDENGKTPTDFKPSLCCDYQMLTR